VLGFLKLNPVIHLSLFVGRSANPICLRRGV
jgi:hypothetical protein